MLSSLQIDPDRLRRDPEPVSNVVPLGDAQPSGTGVPLWVKFALPVLLVVMGMLAVGLWQKLAPDGWRVSQLLGFFGGDLEAAKIKALEEDKIRFEGRLKELEAKLIREKADADARVATVTKAAESRAQQEVLRAQAEKEACVTQIAAAFEMIKTIAAQNTQTATAMARSYLDQEIAKTGGEVGVANLLSVLSAGAVAFGREDVAGQLEQQRRAIASQSEQKVQAAIAESARIIAVNQAEFLQTLPDATTLLKSAGCKVHPNAEFPADRPPTQWPTAPTAAPPKS